MPVNQMWEHILNPVKGWWHRNALDFAAKVSANVTITVYPGRCMSLNSSGELETGVADARMPLFVFQGSEHFDVKNAGDMANGRYAWHPTQPRGYVNCLVATGGYELETTEFDTTKTYAPNDLLTATVANTTQATGGQITKGSGLAAYAQACCGVVSRVVHTQTEGGVSVLSFWPIYLPQTP